MEEKRKLIEENSILESRNQLLSFENEKLKAEMKSIQEYMDTNTNTLKIRIEELEDLVTQYRNMNSPSTQIELEELVTSLKHKVSEKDNALQQMSIKMKEYIKKNATSFNESEAIAKLSFALKERDVIIMKLRNQKDKVELPEKRFINTSIGDLY